MGDEFDLEPLLAYRHAAVEAFADLVGGLAQYLKDCVCDHLLVRCPPRQENLDLDLAAVSIRGGSVYKVCNFSRRRYVKSFPTVGYWLSLVPLLPMLRELLGEFCCWVLTENVGRYSTAARADTEDRVDAAQMLRFMQIAQEEDPLSQLRAFNLRGTTSFFRGANTGNWEDDTSRKTPPQPAADGSTPTTGTPTIPTQPPRHEIILRNLLRNPVVREDLGIVRAQPSLTAAESTPAEAGTAPEAAGSEPATVSPEHLQALVERVSSLETQLAALQTPTTRKRRTKPDE